MSGNGNESIEQAIDRARAARQVTSSIELVASEAIVPLALTDSLEIRSDSPQPRVLVWNPAAQHWQGFSLAEGTWELHPLSPAPVPPPPAKLWKPGEA